MPVRVLLIGMLILLTAFAAPGWSSKPLVEQPADDFDPRWSPDGERIAFVGHEAGNPEVYILDIAANRIRNISNDPRDDYAPLWSPDGAYLTFFHRKQPYASQPHGVRVFDLAAGEVSEALGEGTIFLVGWSGSALIVMDQEAVWRYDAPIRQRTMIFEIPAGRPPLYYALSPDGGRLAISLYTAATYNLLNLVIIDTSSGAASEISGNLTPQNLIWSADGGLLAYTLGGFPYQVTLHVLDLAAMRDREVDQITGGFIENLTWSPDDRLAWVARDNATAINAVRILDELDEPARALFSITPPIERLTWSPTRNHLAFQTYAGVYVADAASGWFSELVQGVGKVEQTEWSPDGDYLASTVYGMPHKNVGALIMTNVLDGAQQVLYRDYFASDIRWSPLADRLVFSSGRYAHDADIETFDLER